MKYTPNLQRDIMCDADGSYYATSNPNPPKPNLIRRVWIKVLIWHHRGVLDSIFVDKMFGIETAEGAAKYIFHSDLIKELKEELARK